MLNYLPVSVYIKILLLVKYPPLPTSTSVNIIVIYSFENACYLDGFKSIWGDMCVSIIMIITIFGKDLLFCF